MAYVFFWLFDPPFLEIVGPIVCPEHSKRTFRDVGQLTFSFIIYIYI